MLDKTSGGRTWTFLVTEFHRAIASTKPILLAPSLEETIGRCITSCRRSCSVWEITAATRMQFRRTRYFVASAKQNSRSALRKALAQCAHSVQALGPHFALHFSQFPSAQVISPSLLLHSDKLSYKVDLAPVYPAPRRK